MKEVYLVIIIAMVMFMNVNSGLLGLGSSYSLDNRPDCIWIWYPKYPRYPPRRTTTVAPSTVSSLTTLTEINEPPEAPGNGPAVNAEGETTAAVADGNVDTVTTEAGAEDVGAK